MMKKELICTALFLCMAGALPSCKDDTPAPDAPPQTESEPKEVDLKEIISEPEDKDYTPDEADVRTQLLPLLADFPAISLEQVQLDASPTESDAVAVAVRVQVKAAENLYSREDAPEAFNEERRATNDAMNRAMMPEAHYLLQVGARSEEIAEEDRKAHPLPAELQTMADELKALAERPVYYLRTPQHTMVELAASMQAKRQNGKWALGELHFDTTPLRAFVALIPESALPQDAAVANEGFEARQRMALREKIEAFNQAAAPHIAAREAAARQRVLEQRSREEEAAKARAEQDAAKAAAREQWQKLCSGVLKDGAVFSGEWKREQAFGTISLRIVKVQSFPESVQFTGVLSDPNLPQAELQVAGRLEQPQQADELVPLIVNIYNGRYDPDAPTAEAFDAKDAMLKLKMAQDGSAHGMLTCAAWQDTPEKDFLITLTHTPVRRAVPVKRPAVAPKPGAKPAPKPAAKPAAAKPAPKPAAPKPAPAPPAA